MAQKIKTMKDLRDDLLERYDSLVKNEIKTDMAHEISNMSGKIMNSAKSQLSYNMHMKKNTPIEFLECN